MSSRTNLKLQLQREQAQRDDDRKGPTNGVSFSSSTGSLSSNDGMSAVFSSPVIHRGSPILRNPNNSPSALSLSSTVPTPVEFQHHYNMSVQNRMQDHPSRFFGDDKYKPRKTYVSNSMGRASPLLHNSLPNQNQLSLANMRQHSLNNSASPMTPDSPMTPHSVGTPLSPAITDVSEMDELIDDIMELESKSGSAQARNARSLTPKEQIARAQRTTSPLPTHQAGNTDYLRMLDPITGKLMPTVSSSCPANLISSVKSESLTEEDVKSYSKDRQKKDNHNIIERKRRDNINNLIKELRTMLPHSSDPSKGSTLKATVDYLKELKKDRERLKILEDRQKNYEHQNRKLAMKVQELERLAEAHGIQLPLNNMEATGMASMAPHLSALITGKGSPQTDSYPGTPTHQQQHHYPSQNQFVQIKQESQSPIPHNFPQYLSMSLPDEFVGVNFSVSELANMMDTAELDPMVSSLTNPFERFDMSEGQQIDMDFLT